MNYDLLLEIADNEEIQEEIYQRFSNLQTLLAVKKILGDLVDISDRLIGYMLYHEQGNNPFVFSTISVIFSLPEELEDKMCENYWALEDWEKEGYPHLDYEEIISLYIPFDLEYSQEQIEVAIAGIESNGICFLVKENHFIAYCESDYAYEMFDDIIDICIKLRLILEGGEANAQSPN